MDNKIPLEKMLVQSYLKTILLNAENKMIIKLLKSQNPEFSDDFEQKFKDSVLETIENDPFIKNYYDDSTIEELINKLNTEVKI